ncbi:hypothetical protein LM13656_260018 [Listeria monocytogenes]|nr:hypothetical protein LM1000505_240018 [Listeria monocytogenes]CUK38644.1 hypothetical protein LM13656_260018 [Listeria monocytogenes]CUM12520.1 hypothetical protein LM900865_10018 [Listeria monocytogenes]CUM23690.1 hypothetical protein LM900701_320018 [Listeria monocytogenes]
MQLPRHSISFASLKLNGSSFHTLIFIISNINTEHNAITNITKKKINPPFIYIRLTSSP